MNFCVGTSSSNLAPAAEAGLLRIVTSALNRVLDSATPAEIVAAAVHSVPHGRLAVVSSFGTESAVLLKHVADVDRTLPVLFLDTGWLFPETLAYRDLLAAQLGLTNVRTMKPQPMTLAARDPASNLWLQDADACCDLRKVAPLAAELGAFDAWINGRKRHHGGQRSNLDVVEVEGPRLKFNPLAHATPGDLEAVFEQTALPRHPLERRGFRSVGCVPCTDPAVAGDTPRSGRWRDRGKTECGIHASTLSASDTTAQAIAVQYTVHNPGVASSSRWPSGSRK